MLDINVGLLFKSFDKKASGSGSLKNYTNQLFKKRKINSLFIDITWSAVFADMQLTSKFN